jgi:AP-2 complex subunit sigma-1
MDSHHRGDAQPTPHCQNTINSSHQIALPPHNCQHSQSPSSSLINQIHFFLLQSRQGKTRLSKWYYPVSEGEKVRIETEVHRTVVSRDKKYTNFIEYKNYKLIYRRYAALFFTIAVDTGDNELAYLESIHLFVELLDAYFSNVRELDIIYNFNTVYNILDEYLLAGEVAETSKKEILERVRQLEKLE